MDSSHAPTPKRTRKFTKSTVTWQLFEKLFLNTSAEAYPLTLGPFTKGRALNLSIGLNTCHVQHKEETGMPEEFMLYSAKPGEIPKGSGEWFVTISTNYTRTGQVRPSRKAPGEDWMAGLLGGTSSHAPAPVLPLTGANPSTVLVDDPQEDLISKYYGGE